VGMGTGGAPETGATNTVKNVGTKAAPFGKGKRTPVEIKREKAKAMKAGGYSYREIGGALGVSPSYAHKLVNGPVPSTRNSSIMDQNISLERFLSSFRNGRNGRNSGQNWATCPTIITVYGLASNNSVSGWKSLQANQKE